MSAEPRDRSNRSDVRDMTRRHRARLRRANRKRNQQRWARRAARRKR